MGVSNDARHTCIELIKATAEKFPRKFASSVCCGLLSRPGIATLLDGRLDARGQAGNCFLH